MSSAFNPLDLLNIFDLRYLAIIIALLGAMVYIWAMANSRFPKITFLTFRGVYIEKQSRRRYGDKVVPDNIITLMLRGDKLLGMDINAFQQVQIRSGNNFQTAYLAENVNGELLPLMKTQKDINIIELTTGKEIATSYIHIVEKSEQQLEKVNPIMAAIYSSLPTVILILAWGLVLFISIGQMNDGNHQNLQIQQQNLELQKQIADSLTGHTAPPPPSPIIQNQTISNGGAVYGR